MLRTLPLLAAVLLPAAASAHHLWIEQDAAGARLHFGEFADNLREASPGRLDKFVKPRAHLVDARGAVRELGLAKQARGFGVAGTAASGDSLIAEETAYPILEKKDGDRLVRTAWTPAARWVTDLQARTPRLTLDLLPAERAGEFVAYYRGQPLAGAKVEAIAQSGWSRTLKTDAQGRIAVPLPWQGLYALEVKHSDPTGGERDGARVDTASYVTTLSFSLPQGLVSLPAPPAAEPGK